MNIGRNQKWLFDETRLVFQEKPDPLTAAVRKSVEAGKNADREAAVARGRELGGANQPRPWETPSAKPSETSSAPGAAPATGDQRRPWETPRAPEAAPAAAPGQEGKPAPGLPELPPSLKWLKVENGVPGKDNPNTLEYPFNFGENSKDLNGKIIMPSNPKEGVKPVLVFNYVKDPDKIDPKLLKAMQENANLQNAIVVTLKTPTGEAQVDDKMINNMTRLTGELEKWQQEMSQKDPKNKPFSLRADQILQIADSDSGDRVFGMLEKYRKSPNADQRIVQYPPFDNNPDSFAANLQRALSQPATGTEDQQSAGPSTVPAMGGGGGGVGGGGGGGMGGGGGGEVAGDSSTAEVEVTAEKVPGTPETGNPGVSENKELAAEGVDKLLILGDSNLTYTQNLVSKKYQGNQIERTAADGKHLADMVGELKDRESLLDNLSTDKARGTILVNGGGNDLAAGKTDAQIFGYMKKMALLAKKHNLKIFFCAITPFGDTTYQSLQKDFKIKNDFRTSVNTQLYALAKDPEFKNTVGVIPLDKRKSEGGVADDDDPNKLHKDYRDTGNSPGDGLHLNGAGANLLADLAFQQMGQAAVSREKTGEQEGKETPASQPGKKLSAFSENSPAFNEWAISTRKRLLANGSPQQVYVKVEYNGRPLLGILRPHDIIGATGEKAPPGTIGFETYEYDVDSDPQAQKKSPEIVKGGVEKQPDLLNGKVDFYINYPSNFNPSLPTELVVYATPNKQDPLTVNGPGNQIARQAELLRNSSDKYRGKNLIIAYVSPLTRDWPHFLKQNQNAGNDVLQAVTARVKDRFKPLHMDVSFDSHSGGGAFAFNIMNSRNEIPPEVKHLDFFDSLYFYQDISHARMIKQWLDRSTENTFTLVSGTPQIVEKQKMLIGDLEKQGVRFSRTEDQLEYSEQVAFNGRLRIKTLKMFDHGGTVTRNGFAFAHDPQAFNISSRMV